MAVACLAAAIVAGAGAIAHARADVAPHFHLLAIASVPPHVFSARVVYYPSNNQFAKNSVVSGCFTGLQPGRRYLFPRTLVIADDNNIARQDSLTHNVTVQGFADTTCQAKFAFAEILVQHNDLDYWWISENTLWLQN
jgi:hypothetical protein